MSTITKIFFSFAVIFIIHGNLNAKPEFSRQSGKSSDRFLEVSKCAKGPVIDGQINDKVWKTLLKNKKNSSFAFYALHNWKVSLQQTLFYATRDDNYLYFAILCEDPEMDYIVTQYSKRDENIWEDDSVEIFLFEKNKYFYQFIINSSGTIYDAKKHDKTWNSKGIKIKTSKHDSYWIAEVAIPLDELKLPKESGSVVNFNVCRNYYIEEDNYILQQSSWSRLKKRTYTDPDNYGKLIFKSN